MHGMFDWTSDLLFPADVAMLKRSDTGDLSYPQKTKPTSMDELKRTETQ